MLVFVKDEIVLDLPTDDSELKVVDGWKILPLTYPQVKKNILIHYVYERIYCTCLYRLTKLILSSLSVIEMSLDVQLSWSGQEMVNHSSSPVK